jgi:hypothetical protein
MAPSHRSPRTAKYAKEICVGHERKNEGEGNKTAAREYNRGATRHARSGQPQQKARDAAEALDGPERDEMSRAAERGKAPLREER